MLKHVLRLLIVFAFVLPAYAQQGYHLWYDENGQAVYSQFAPGSGRQSEAIKPPPPPAEAPEVAQERLRQQLQQFEDNREDAALAAQEAREAEQALAQAAERCTTARQQLELLNGPSRRLFRNSDGTVSRLSEAQREEKRAEMQQIIDADCPG
jgi:hypothetical protein